MLSEYIGAKSQIYVRHNYCGYTYNVRADSFLRGARCHKCVGQIRYTDSTIRKRLVKVFGDEYVFCEEYKGSNSPIKTLHKPCGITSKQTPNKLFNFGARCGYCYNGYSKGETYIAEVLTELGVEFYREVPLSGEPRRRFDFYLPEYNFYIEYDGRHHFEAIEHWGGVEKLHKQLRSDFVKNEYCDYHGAGILRIPWAFYKDMPIILSQLIEDLRRGKIPDYLGMPINSVININEMEKII